MYVLTTCDYFEVDRMRRTASNKVSKVKLFEYVIHFKWFESVEQLRTI